MTNNKEIKQIKVSKIFDEDQYIVPIYQRNYAWEYDEIKQLIDDINDYAIKDEDKNYFLGTLIVNKQKDKLFEVIDGQQRLTTLYLLKKFLEEGKFDSNADILLFEAREKYKRTLQVRNIKEIKNDKSNYYAQELIDGYKFISEYFKEESKNIDDFKNKLDKVFLVRVQVPEKIDLNHYFEIMNTRGEQLEPHEILKAKILEKLESIEKTVATDIWEKCSDMNHYIQMNFENNLREKIFGEEWNKFEWKNFDNLKEAILGEVQWKSVGGNNNKDILCPNDDINSFINNIQNENKKKIAEFIESQEFSLEQINAILASKKLDDDELQKIHLRTDSPLNEVVEFAQLLPKYPQDDKKKNEEDDGKETRFESIISFPNFLLQVNAILNKKEQENDDGYLDDKNFLVIMENNYKNPNTAKEFVFNLLKYRFLFDKYVLKRDYNKEKREGEWSLKRLQVTEKKQNNGKTYKSPSYVNTFNEIENETENNFSDEQESKDNARLKLLQASLRITYTSPKTMKWIAKLLKAGANPNSTCQTLINELENYCRKAVVTIFDVKNLKYGKLDRIVFSYLDYVLYRDGHPLLDPNIRKNWKCVYRKSIEHFSPQTSGIFSDKPDTLHSFGNLALITVSGNSKFSNMQPEQKILEKEDIINQSLKLSIMAKLCDDEEGWTQEKIKSHEKNMIDILKKDLEFMPISLMEPLY